MDNVWKSLRSIMDCNGLMALSCFLLLRILRVEVSSNGSSSSSARMQSTDEALERHTLCHLSHLKSILFLVLSVSLYRKYRQTFFPLISQPSTQKEQTMHLGSSRECWHALVSRFLWLPRSLHTGVPSPLSAPAAGSGLRSLTTPVSHPGSPSLSSLSLLHNSQSTETSALCHFSVVHP